MFAVSVDNDYCKVLSQQKVVFYKDGKACNCKICEKFPLFWKDFEIKENSYGVEITKDVKIKDIDFNKMKKKFTIAGLQRYF